MKRIFLLAVILGALAYMPQVTGYEAKAQVNFEQTASNPTGAITDASIDTMTRTLTRGYSRILVSCTYTRVTGTAAGTAILEYRVSTSDNWKSDVGDTLSFTNVASQTVYWNKTVPARRWRIRVGGGTTVTATVAARLQTD